MKVRDGVSGRLIVVSGLPGVGKSTAEQLAESVDAVRLSVDLVEEALIGSGLEPGWTTGVAAYEAVRAAAETNLVHGRIVIVDAVNDSEPARETWRRAAAQTSADLRWIVLACSDLEEHARRLGDRDRGFTFVSEPSWDDLLERRANYAPWIDRHAEIDTAQKSPAEVATEIAQMAT